jgi:hypothetical protein
MTPSQTFQQQAAYWKISMLLDGKIGVRYRERISRRSRSS